MTTHTCQICHSKHDNAYEICPTCHAPATLTEEELVQQYRGIVIKDLLAVFAPMILLVVTIFVPVAGMGMGLAYLFWAARSDHWTLSYTFKQYRAGTRKSQQLLLSWLRTPNAWRNMNLAVATLYSLVTGVALLLQQ